jgi:NAD(P)-dependent dehydrogenase (short-subunit alcohol dehydrogenase family)
MSKKFTNKSVLVVGGSSGIGEAIAMRFIEEGAKTIIFDINKPKFQTEYFEVDIRNEKDIVSAIKNIRRLDVLINSAGIYKSHFIEDVSVEEMDNIIDINLKGTMLICKHALNKLKETKGNIINISSCLGLISEPSSPVYCASKAGLLMFSRCLSQEYSRYSVRVNTVLPGPIDTPLLRNSYKNTREMKKSREKNPMRKIGLPDDIANVVLFLASNEANFVNGGEYSVDGGESVSSVYSINS